MGARINSITHHLMPVIAKESDYSPLFTQENCDVIDKSVGNSSKRIKVNLTDDTDDTLCPIHTVNTANK